MYFFIILCLNIIIIAANPILYDYCNINESKTAYLIINEAKEYFNLTNEKCLLLNNNFKNYYERFDNLEKDNKNAYGVYKCTECDKKFKSLPFLNLHYRLFHTSKIDNYHSLYYCPSDLCNFLNCDRYKYFLGIPFPESNKEAAKFHRIVTEKTHKCDKDLVNFYRNSCMKMIEGCLNEETDIDKYFDYYENFCLKIDCEREAPEYNYKHDLPKDEGALQIFRIIFIYVVLLFSFIYIVVVWISKYS